MMKRGPMPGSDRRTAGSGWVRDVSDLRQSRRHEAMNGSKPLMKILSIHAHFDDYEFTAAGTFEMWKRKLGGRLRAKVIVCTDGKAGHHFQTREETGRIRLQEQLASAKIGGYEFEKIALPERGGSPGGVVQGKTCLPAGVLEAILGVYTEYFFL